MLTFFYKNYVKLHQKKRFVDFANEIYWRTECAGAVTQIKIDDYKIYVWVKKQTRKTKKE